MPGLLKRWLALLEFIVEMTLQHLFVAIGGEFSSNVVLTVECLHTRHVSVYFYLH